MPGEQRHVFVQTFGCQMNVYDTERIYQVLRPLSYTPTDDPSRADLILLNTCSVRDKAEHKMLSALGRFHRLKEYNDELLLGVGGCVATQEGERLLAKVPYLDLVFGTDNIGELPALLSSVRQGEGRRSHTKFANRRSYEWVPLEPQDGERQVTAMLTVMKGCNKFCSFCIVPFTRGREVSKPAELVVEEARRLAEGGVREVMLLGQNVNSYGLDREGEARFPELLARVAAVPGIERVRFTTSHPVDCTDELIAAFDGRIPELCEYFHLPVQSGSDTMLRKMRRGYSIDDYRDRLRRLREARPGIALSTDIIVGFPGETEEQHQATLDLLREVRFDAIYSFKYSERPGTSASRLTDNVPEELKSERLAQVQALQDAITRDRMVAYEGTVAEVLVEGPSRHARAVPGLGAQLMGRTRTNIVVNFSTPISALAAKGWGADSGVAGLVGSVVNVHVTRALPHSLAGELAPLH